MIANAKRSGSPAQLLQALGVVPDREVDKHLAARLDRLAKKAAGHIDRCEKCSPRELCEVGSQLVTALVRAAAAGTGRYWREVVN